MIIYIYNNVVFHYEVIESVIQKYDQIIGKEKADDDIIYLTFGKNSSFRKYIREKYPSIILSKPKKFDYSISCTIYEKQKDRIIKDEKHFYVSHEVFETDNKNVFFVTPLCGNGNSIMLDVLPFPEHKKMASIPIFAVQGYLWGSKRDLALLDLILQEEYDYDFRIKIIGSRNLNGRFDKYGDKVINKYRLNFVNFHKEFLDCYSIIPLISKKNFPVYYTKKLTSTINYAIAYDLNILIDQDLQDIYNLKNASVYKDDSDIVRVFREMLKDFYTK